MATRLKRLELQGFKSFPDRTTFEFDPGITAVIGPNGSGKSNIADAMRWVLGEQSYSNLRGRRAEDIIFSGSSGRAPLGMAEVALTLDNTSGELPVSFAEVTITRRAYRSGENHYLLNGSRVRLKDIQQVTSSLGQAYTVIGQGLVDAALSQRPEERRGLFEHAAGITGLRLKHATTSRHLAETASNSTRLEDLLGEIEPRLRSLERQAKQAREYVNVRDDLQEKLLTWYAHRWQFHATAIQEATESLAAIQQTLSDAQNQRTTQSARQEQVREQHQELTQRISSIRTALEQLREQRSTAEHQIALAQERRTALAQRREDSQARIDELEQQQVTLYERRAEIEASKAELSEYIETQEHVADDLTKQGQEIARQRATLEQQLADLQQRRQRLGQRRVEIQGRLDVITQQQHDIVDQRQHILHDRERHEQARQTLNEERTVLEDQARALHTRRADLETRRAELQVEISASRQQIDQLTQDVTAKERALVEAQTRLQTLERLRESGAGLFAGTKAVLEQARSNNLSGIVGTIASLITVPEDYETAIEVALGGHLQDIVVERWKNAEQAIEYLKSKRIGRATFQPLDTVRDRRLDSLPVERQAGVHGIAARLLTYDTAVEPIINGLLGRVLVVDDLQTSRAVIRDIRGGWSIVTLSGEISRSSGAVTGGARVRESGSLARERELRELPKRCATLEAELTRLRQALQEARTSIDQQEAESQRLGEQRYGLTEEIRTSEDRTRAIQRELATIERDETAGSERVSVLDERRQQLDNEQTSLHTEWENLNQEERNLDQSEAPLQEQIEQLGESTAHSDQRAEILAELSELRERHRNLSRQLQEIAQQESQFTAESAQASQRLAEINQTVDDLDQQQNQQQQQLTEIERREKTTNETLPPVEQQLAQVDSELHQIEENREHHQQRLHELERERDRRELELNRRQDEQAVLAERAGYDLETDNPGELLAGIDFDPNEINDQLERTIQRLRDRLRRIGAIGEDVIEQYESEKERYEFLSKQLSDVREAAESLQALLSELEQSMAHGFDEAFERVAGAFSSTFSRLFGGGHAKLVRTDDDELSGIDIVAQPPGKRLQSLALLSGGERALTATALLFAILRVNPSPFCLLDEIDAALDEANVVRVRDELRDLANQTQFVVVTHNRATIEGADTLYGITMGRDAVSRVLSLRMPDELKTTTDAEQAEPVR